MRHANMELLIKANKKCPSFKKCTEREYHVQKDSDVAHKCVRMFCNTNKFP